MRSSSRAAETSTLDASVFDEYWASLGSRISPPCASTPLPTPKPLPLQNLHPFKESLSRPNSTKRRLSTAQRSSEHIERHKPPTRHIYSQSLPGVSESSTLLNTIHITSLGQTQTEAQSSTLLNSPLPVAPQSQFVWIPFPRPKEKKSAFSRLRKFLVFRHRKRLEDEYATHGYYHWFSQEVKDGMDAVAREDWSHTWGIPISEHGPNPTSRPVRGRDGREIVVYPVRQGMNM